MAWADIQSITRHPAITLVAVADVDLNRTGEVKRNFPNARIYQDWRELLDKEKSIDSVNVSTPDHMHGPIAMSALQRGKHVHCQKPLTHDLYETRQLTLVAREKKLVTQMGVQIHSGTEYRTAVKLIQDLMIGKVKEVHTWSGKKWGDTAPMPQRTDPVPEGLNWDLWVGVCAMRPFIGDGWYHPGNWRKRLDFGTGTFGDMGCHIYDPVFKALALTDRSPSVPMAPLPTTIVGPSTRSLSMSSPAPLTPKGRPSRSPGTMATSGRRRTCWRSWARPRCRTRVQFPRHQGRDAAAHVGRPVLLPEKDFEGYERIRVAGETLAAVGGGLSRQR